MRTFIKKNWVKVLHQEQIDLSTPDVVFAIHPLITEDYLLLWHVVVYIFVSARFFLQRFTPGARVLTDKETKAFLSAADDDSDGRIGADGEKFCTYFTRYS